MALSQYQEIIDHHNDGIYSDEALFFYLNKKTVIYFCGSRKKLQTIAGH
jgi:hypothetical protein